jgi:hypothetical protein
MKHLLGHRASARRLAFSPRNHRDLFARTRELLTLYVIGPDVHAPWSQAHVPSLRLRLHVPNPPPSPCSIGGLGSGDMETEEVHARLLHVVVVKKRSVWREKG